MLFLGWRTALLCATVPPPFLKTIKIGLFFLATAFLLPSLCYKIRTLKKLLPEGCSALQLVAFALGNGPSSDGLTEMGKIPPCVPKGEPLSKSHGDVWDRYGMGEACRVMAASVIWTRCCKDRPGAQMAYFTFPLHSPLPASRGAACVLV